MNRVHFELLLLLLLSMSLLLLLKLDIDEIEFYFINHEIDVLNVSYLIKHLIHSKLLKLKKPSMFKMC